MDVKWNKSDRLRKRRREKFKILNEILNLQKKYTLNICLFFFHYCIVTNFFCFILANILDKFLNCVLFQVMSKLSNFILQFYFFSWHYHLLLAFCCVLEFINALNLHHFTYFLASQLHCLYNDINDNNTENYCNFFKNQ